MRKILFFLSLCCLFFGTAHAMPITNASFESGLTGWNKTGNVSVVSGTLVSTGNSSLATWMTPTDGNKFARIKAGNTVSSLTSSDFTVAAGDTISFDWFFSAEDYLPYNDYSKFSLEAIVGNVSVVSGLLADVLSVGNFGLTGWNTASIMSPVSGDMSLNFFSVNAYDTLGDSILGVDNIQVSRVPEPGTLALMGLGMLMVRRQVGQKRSTAITAT